MKKILIVFLIIINFTNTYTQSTDYKNATVKYKEAFNKADFIFEGVVKKRDYYHRPDKFGNVWVMFSDIVEIKKIFRTNGKLKIGTIEITSTTNVQLVNDKRETLIDNDSVWVFFCREATEFPFDVKYNIDMVDNKTILTPYVPGGRGFSFLYLSLDAFEFNVSSKHDFYLFLKTLPNIDVNAIDEQAHKIYMENLENAKNMPPPLPCTPQGHSQAYKDSLNNKLIKKSIYIADSIYQIKWKAQKDSIKTINDNLVKQNKFKADSIYNIKLKLYNSQDSLENIKKKNLQ